jgi:diketogulonate reductase-like aldo/keto reductase
MNPLLKRQIPSSGEKLPVIGLGTWKTFDVGESESDRSLLKVVLQELFEGGASVIDSSPMYGRSEKVVGDLSSELRLNDKLFLATKVWTSGKEDGIRQMNASLSLLKRRQLGLMQIHNLVDWEVHLRTLRQWKEEGKIRYIGITHYTAGALPAMEKIMRDHPIDFIQLNYSIESRDPEKRVLPLAQDQGIAVLVNQPFEEGVLFQRVKGKSLPSWTSEFDCNSWAQFFLKFIITNPAVTCVIPGTSKPHHLIDNLKGGTGELPDNTMLQKMITFMNSI